MNNTLYILIAPSGCGKTRYAKELAKEVNGDYLSSDSLRLKLIGDETNQNFNELVFNVLYNNLAVSLAMGRDSILDTTALTRQVREEPIRIARRYGAHVKAIVFKTDIAVAKERNKSRDRQVPEHVIDRQYKIIEYPTLDEVDSIEWRE